MRSARWGSPDYDGLLKDALESIAHQLERDLERNERENNYITDDTAKNLKSAVSEPERCGIKVVFNILEWIPYIPQDLAIGMAISAGITVPLITTM